ncbi:MAG TPA: ATP-binding protein [Gaiellaceae bacterium]|nr:ATP-binding protein [Gaiellaceae bacterium]
MSRLPIRLRLTLVFAVAMGLVLAAAGWFVYARVASDLNRALDEQLRARAQDLSALVRRGGSLGTTVGPFIEPGESFAELIAADGRVLDATEPIGSRRLISRADLARARRETVFVNRSSVPGLDEPARMLAVPLEERVLIVGATRENRAEILRSLLAAFLIGGPLALLLASLAGYALAGAALRPIEAMRKRAAEISTSSLAERLPVPPAQDEVSRLGTTLNEMLARLEDGIARERRFVADASHELRTPLALLKTELELALRRARSPEELEDAVRSAAESTERLSRIAEDLLLLARAEQGRLPLDAAPTDVTDVMGTVAERFRPRAETEGRRVSVDADDALVVSADRVRLEQALSNMVDNAFRHGRGQITLTAHARSGAAELHVLDEGTGFPPEFLDRAFERFSRADESRAGDGSGLGLAIVETIARAHHGAARATNREGGGADISIALPLA